VTDSQPPRPRSKRIYVYWGVALFLLLGLGLFCWLVVVPFLQVRPIVEQCDTIKTSLEVNFLGQGNAGVHIEQDFDSFVDELGGKDRAFRCLSIYVALPNCVAGHKGGAAGACQ
jgi:hypothetical protein